MSNETAMTTPTPTNLTSGVGAPSPNGADPDGQEALDHLDDYLEQPDFKRRARPTGPLTWALLALVFAAGIFSLGAKMGRDSVPAATPTTGTGTARRGAGAAAFLAGRGSGTGSGTATGSGTGSGAGGATIGSVQLVDGTNVYLQTTSGGVVKVTTTPASKINVTAPGTLAQHLESTNILAVSEVPGHLLATINCHDLIIIHTPKATLVCPAKDAEKIKQLVALVEKHQGKEFV